MTGSNQNMEGPDELCPSLETVQELLSKPLPDVPPSSSSSSSSSSPGRGGKPPGRPNMVPIYGQMSSDLITPSAAYLKVTAHAGSAYSFLFESAANEQVERYSFVGAGPRAVLKTGPGHGDACDPLPALERELAGRVVLDVPGLKLPPLTGGAIGYVGYDCVQYFEPKTARPLKDVHGIPESFFMLFDTIVAFDRFFGVIKVITYLNIPPTTGPDGSPVPAVYYAAEVAAEYSRCAGLIRTLTGVLNAPETPLPPQGPIRQGVHEYTSNIGQEGYEAHVRRLRRHIEAGDVIQAVPSQRLARPTDLHPFNAYRHLRTVNPSPYLFYLDCGGGFQVVGASPELLVRSRGGRIVTHPIAGTVPRGADDEEDDRLARELQASLKDRAEHVMLVDLARNDVTRVCDPLETRVDHLMKIAKFSHVQHLVSQVSSVLRPECTRFDAFRSIFPAGTTSGAPKVKAMELIAELEGEKRGIYAGAVGWFGYGSVDPAGRARDGDMDTCIALRTMLIKEGVVYMQAGGGIVYDSDPYDEYVETLNKLRATMNSVVSAEEKWAREQQGQGQQG